jgi:VIT1/CCC1 family predicted Fe2+/Mn2+ transporter
MPSYYILQFVPPIQQGFAGATVARGAVIIHSISEECYKLRYYTEVTGSNPVWSEAIIFWTFFLSVLFPLMLCFIHSKRGKKHEAGQFLF